jgi:phage-related protein
MSKILNDWTFDGVRLSSFGAVTQLDAYLDIPPKRGDNIPVPMQHGKTWVPKFYDSRIVSFGLEVAGTSIIDLEQKMDALKALLGARTQKALVHGFCDEDRSALAEVLNQLSVTRDSDPLVVDMVVDFLLADPFFRSSVIANHVFDIPNSLYTLDNPGSAEECRAVITFADAWIDPILTNTANGVVLQYSGTIAGGDTVTIDCGAFTAVHSVSGNVIGNIVHTGAPAFMVLLPGVNIMTISDDGGADTGTGTVHIDFYPPYL